MPDGDADDPIRVRSPWLFALFATYLRWYFSRHFHAIRVARSGLPRLPDGRPVVVFTNHPGWWDPALFIVLMDRLLPGRIGYGPMEARAFARYGVMRRMGVFGIDLDRPRGAARFLDVGLRVLRRPESVLWITAEGAFTDTRARPVRLRPGLAHLARRAEGAVLLPMALEYTFWNERLPEVLVRFGAPIAPSPGRGVAEWTALLASALAETMDALAEDAVARDPARFRTVLTGIGGAGGLYDLWRRLRALLRGEAPRLSHEDAAE